MLGSNSAFVYLGNADTAASTEATATPGVGLVQTVGQIPALAKVLQQPIGVGLAAAAGQIPVVAGFVFPSVGAISAAGQIPGKYTELLQGVGLGSCSVGGQAPSISGWTFGGLGSVVASGLQPSLYTALTQEIGAGAVSVAGQPPTALPEGAIGPAQGAISVAGLAPSLYIERILSVGVGEVVAEGLAPELSGNFTREITPDPALVSIGGQKPTVETPSDEATGTTVVRARKSRYYGPEYVEVSETSVPVIALQPQPAITVVVADYQPDNVLRLDTTQTEYRLTQLESQRALTAKRRREEEELLAILLKAA